MYLVKSKGSVDQTLSQIKLLTHLPFSSMLLMLCLLFFVGNVWAQQLSEIGVNDFKISPEPADILSPPDPGATTSAIAFNTTDNQYLVVWSQLTIRGENCPLFPLIYVREILAQLVDGNNGTLIGNAVRVSESCSVASESKEPDVVYNSTDNQYLVVWSEDDENILADDEFEIFGQILSNNLASVGVNNFRISDMGWPVDDVFDAFNPNVIYNSIENEYLVVWNGNDNTNGLVGDEYEIFGQRLNNNGTAQGINDFRISDMGGTGSTFFDAFSPSVTYNSSENEYLVVWQGDDNINGQSDNELEIFGQLLDQNGGEIGSNDFRISDMGGTGSTFFDAFSPSVTYNSSENEYLVVWYGDDDINGLINNEFEIFGQLLNGNSDEIGINDFRISDMGGTGDNPFDARRPEVSYNSIENEYLVVWSGDNDVNGLIDHEFEIFGQLLDQNGIEQGANDFRISDMGGTGDALFNATLPSVIYNSVVNEYLVAWQGDDNVGELTNDELRILGQQLSYDSEVPIFENGFE